MFRKVLHHKHSHMVNLPVKWPCSYIKAALKCHCLLLLQTSPQLGRSVLQVARVAWWNPISGNLPLVSSILISWWGSSELTWLQFYFMSEDHKPGVVPVTCSLSHQKSSSWTLCHTPHCFSPALPTEQAGSKIILDSITEHSCMVETS